MAGECSGLHHRDSENGSPKAGPPIDECFVVVDVGQSAMCVRGGRGERASRLWFMAAFFVLRSRLLAASSVESLQLIAHSNLASGLFGAASQQPCRLGLCLTGVDPTKDFQG